MSTTTSTPILFLVFNRPEHTRRVFERIRAARPARLYVSADGPRAHVATDAENSRLTRQVIESVDWECSVRTLYRERNLGCRPAVQSGIDWFFENEEAGIILEDDCLPDLSFFRFCAEMLERYADDERVMHISGNNPAARACRKVPTSYVFSKFSFIWGWASWRRAWRHYDGTFRMLEQAPQPAERLIADAVKDATAARYLLDKFLRTRDGELNTWDYAWFYSILMNEGWCANSASNLVENIGFDHAATHTNQRRAIVSQHSKVAPAQFPLRHPDQIARDERIERAFFHASQKGRLGLLLRQIAPDLFFKK